MSSGHIRARGPGSWELKFDAGRDPLTGARIVRYKTIKGAKRDAQRELRALLDAVDRGTHTDPGKLTLGDWLDRWMTGRQHTISPKTTERYGELIEKHIKPKLGAVALAKVTTGVLNEFYADRLARGRLDGKGGLSPQTVRHLDRLLHRAFYDAIKQRLLSMNPTDYVERPKVERKAKRSLDDADLQALLGKAEGGRLFAPLFLILAGGMRRGELLALTWRHVDMTTGQAQIVHTIEETRSGGLRVKDCKTAAGRRRVDLPASAIDVLRRHQIEQKRQHLSLGLGWTADTLIFSDLAGGVWRPRNFTKAVSALAKAAGVTFSPHAGRHDHFTRLLQAGVHPKVAQTRAGHSSISVTMDTYSHATDGMQRVAAEQIDNVLRKFRQD